MPGITRQTTDDWRAARQNYWMFGTGAGVTVLIAAGLGLLVGVVVVAQTIYAAPSTTSANSARSGDGRDQRLHLSRDHRQAVISAVGGYAIPARCPGHASAASAAPHDPAA